MSLMKLTAEQKATLAKIRHVALDMDGTIYSGKTLFSFTAEALDIFTQTGVGYTFLTNNSSKSVSDYLTKIENLGIKADGSQIYTSSLATIEYLESNFGKNKKLFIFGTLSLRREFVKAGFGIATELDGDEPDIVVVGFDTELTYERMCKAAYWIARGKPYIATHPDKICPTDQPVILVDCGAVCACLEEATSRRPDIVLGKPNPCMIKGILKRHTLEPCELAMVGDRLYTDMAMAVRAHTVGALVLSGETKRSDLEDYSPMPDIVASNILSLAKAIRESKYR